MKRSAALVAISTSADEKAAGWGAAGAGVVADDDEEDVEGAGCGSICNGADAGGG